MQSPQCKALTTAALGLPLSWLPGVEVSSLALRTWDPDKAETLLGLLCCQPAQTPSEPCCLSVLPEPSAAPGPGPVPLPGHKDHAEEEELQPGEEEAEVKLHWSLHGGKVLSSALCGQ